MRLSRWWGVVCARLAACADDQLKLRYKDFTTITRAHSPGRTDTTRQTKSSSRSPTLSQELDRGTQCACSGCKPHPLRVQSGAGRSVGRRTPPEMAASAVGGRSPADKFGESQRCPASGLRGSFRERTHENPAGRQERTVRDPRVNVRVPISHAFARSGIIRTTRPADVVWYLHLQHPQALCRDGTLGPKCRFSQKCARIGAPRVSPGLY